MEILDEGILKYNGSDRLYTYKAGVYFEAGYALGRGQKVIYTCKKDDISNAHFDTRNYQHIVWETADDLKQKLIDKINAFVLD